MGHFVNYRKQASPSLDDLLPEAEFKLFAVCARFPQNLAARVTLTPLRDAVYEVNGFGLAIRVIVANQLPLHDNNAMLLLFSAREKLLQYGRAHYHPHSRDTSSVLLKIFTAYSEESDMPDKLKEFVRQTLDELVAKMTPEERLKGMSAEEVIRALPPETLEELKKKLKANGHSPKPE